MEQHKSALIQGCDVPECSHVSYSKRDLQLHKQSEHSIWSYRCQLCGKGFDQLKQVRWHVMLRHKTDDPAGPPPATRASVDLKHHFLERRNANNLKQKQRQPQTAEEHQVLVCKDEIEEVVFD
jgi:hypothetical protein